MSSIHQWGLRGGIETSTELKFAVMIGVTILLVCEGVYWEFGFARRYRALLGL